MPRQRRQSDELVQASDHLHYEFWMFMSLANALGTGIFGQGVLNNAILESFTVHARLLLDFLYSDHPKADDVIAEDFLEDPSAWQDQRPQQSQTVAAVHRRVGKEVAHLTYARHEITPEAKLWPFAAIAQEFEATFSRYLALVPLDLLSPRWDEYKRQRREKGDSA